MNPLLADRTAIPAHAHETAAGAAPAGLNKTDKKGPAGEWLERHCPLLGWLFVGVLGLLTVAGLWDLPLYDGVSYLDMGGALLRGDWAMAVNAYWSPLYPLIAGVVLRLFRPSPAHEFAFVQLAYLAILLFVAVCFELLLREFLGRRSPGINPALLRLFACCVFIAGALLFVEGSAPDLLVVGFVFLAARSLIRLHDASRARTWFGLGASLGLGYLAKAAMLPIGIAFIASAVLATGGVEARRRWRGAALAVVGLLVFAGPWIAALSRHEGHLTFGASGGLNYAWNVDDARPHELSGATGTAQRPLREIMLTPQIYSYAALDTASYPLWYAPAFWWRNVHPQFNVRRQFIAIARNLDRYHVMFFHRAGVVALLFALATLLLWAGTEAPRLAVISSHGHARSALARAARALRYWYLLLPCAAALALYCLVYVEDRYIAGFFVVACLSVLFSVDLPARLQPAARGLVAMAVIFAAADLGLVLVKPGLAAIADHLRGRAHSDIEAAIASGLHAAGVPAGSTVATIGTPWDCYWARLAGVSITAELRNSDAWLLESPAVRAGVIRAIAATGARAIVIDPRAWRLVPHRLNGESPTPQMPSYLRSWRRLGDSGAFAYVYPAH
jgi:hypothetical protein